MGKPKGSANSGGKKIKMTVSIDSETLEQCRAISYYYRTTLSDLVATTMQKEIKRLQRKDNEGEPFETKDVKLKIGRPLKLK